MYTREGLRERLCQRAADELLPEGRFKIPDGNGGMLAITSRGGDIGVQCISNDYRADVIFSGSGGHAPLVREALRLLALAIQEEGGDVKKV